jgi:hypothetical protein
MNVLWHVFTGDKDPSSLQTGSMPVGARIVSSLDTALSIIRAEYPEEDLDFTVEGTSVTESEFRKLADAPGGSQKLVVLGQSGVERIRDDHP